MNALPRQNTPDTALIAISAVFVILDILTVGLSLWGRRIKKKTLDLNDSAIIVGLVEKA